MARLLFDFVDERRQGKAPLSVAIAKVLPEAAIRRIVVYGQNDLANDFKIAEGLTKGRVRLDSATSVLIDTSVPTDYDEARRGDLTQRLARMPCRVECV